MMNFEKFKLFISYIKGKLENNGLFLVLFIVICVFLQKKIEGELATSFYYGVLASIAASVLYELYIGFCKKCEINNIRKKYLALFNRQLELFTYRLAVNHTTCDVASNCGVSIFQILASRDAIVRLKNISALLEKFDEQFIYKESRKKEVNGNVKNRIGLSKGYDDGIDLYFIIKEFYLNDLHKCVEEISKVLPFYFEEDDYKLSELMFNVWDETNRLFIIFPSDREAFYDGRPILSMKFINSLFSLTIELAEYIKKVETL